MIVLRCALPILLLVVLVDGYCVYNRVGHHILVETYKKNVWAVVTRYLARDARSGLPTEIYELDTTHVNAGETYCCAWNDSACYLAEGANYPYSLMTVSHKWAHVTLKVQCGRKSRVYTHVVLPAGGFLKVHPSPTGADNYIDVYGHLGDRRWWYRCGTHDEWHDY